MKLNNRGWGLQVMMIFVMILMIGLVIVYSLIQNTLGNLVNKYQKTENKVIAALKTYYNNLDIKLEEDQEKYVTVKTLIQEDLLENIDCSGYGIYKKDNDEVIYKAYIKCTDYITDGYLEYLDEKN